MLLAEHSVQALWGQSLNRLKEPNNNGIEGNGRDQDRQRGYLHHGLSPFLRELGMTTYGFVM